MGVSVRDERRPREDETIARLVAEHRLETPQVVKASRQARSWKTSVREALIAEGAVTNRDWAIAAATSSGLPLADLRAVPPDRALLDPADRIDYLRLGALPWQEEGGCLILAAQTPGAPELLAWAARRFPDRAIGWAVTTKFDILWALQQAFDPLADEEAREALFSAAPHLSAKTTVTRAQLIAVWVGLSLLLLGLGLAPLTTAVLASGLVTVFYMLSFAFRFLLTWVGAHHDVDISVTEEEVKALHDEDLPVFSVLVPMYREAEVLPILVHSIRRMDYPLAKLDVKLVLEADDIETIEAAKALRAEGVFEIIRVPTSQPKTKPKACNYALHFARGEYTVVFDAEDMPESDQLKKVVAMFRRSPEHVACIQARLNYFNRRENFLTRMFTLEYSNWFDYLLPGLHVLRVPIPLGGTSNHFRTKVLRELGAWDPYNVTEDADLGVRLTQVGYEVAVVNSTTFEEANGVLRSWINQRSRWIKGYMQTWLVHMRQPVRLYRRLGNVGFWGFQFFIGFPVLTSVVNPLLWVTTLVAVVFGADVVSVFFPPPVIYIAMFNLVVGNAMYVYLTMVAAAKRGWFQLMPWALLAPAYWMLHSIAAYKAMWQLIVAPHYWEKTKHGTSSTTQETLAALTRPGQAAPAP